MMTTTAERAVALGALLAAERRALEDEMERLQASRPITDWERYAEIPLLLEAIETLQRGYPEARRSAPLAKRVRGQP